MIDLLLTLPLQSTDISQHNADQVQAQSCLGALKGRQLATSKHAITYGSDTPWENNANWVPNGINLTL